MKIIRSFALTCLVALTAVSASAADLTCNTSNVEHFRYSWRLRGGVRFLAGLLFPTSGVGNLRTMYPQGDSHAVRSELLITAPEGKQAGFFEYGSDIDDRGAKTLTTTNGYAWGEKSRNEHTTIYTDGKEYPVVFRPTERRNFVIEGKNTQALGFEIVDAPGGRKWPGGVKVWLSNDDRRIPVRIEIQQSIASLQLDLKAVESCTEMASLNR
jgi:hypothetical protein